MASRPPPPGVAFVPRFQAALLSRLPRFRAAGQAASRAARARCARRDSFLADRCHRLETARPGELGFLPVRCAEETRVPVLRHDVPLRSNLEYRPSRRTGP